MTLGPRKQIGSAFLVALAVLLITLESLGLPGVTRVIVGTIVGLVGMVAFQSLVDARRMRAELQRIQLRLSEAVKSEPSKQPNSLGPDQTTASLSETVNGFRATGEAQLKELQHLRSDIEWLEQVLQGVTNGLSGLSTAPTESASDASADRASVKSLAEDLEDSRAVLKSSAELRDIRVLRPSPDSRTWDHSARRINRILAGRERTARYLEVGVEGGRTFEAVRANIRVGVDPVPLFDTTSLPPNCSIFIGTSDDFFQMSSNDFHFDVILINGLHTFEQVYRDLLNSLKRLKTGGVVVVDDVVPPDEVSAMPHTGRFLDKWMARELTGTPSHGDVYKLVPAIRDLHPELKFCTIMGSGDEQLLVWQGTGILPSAVPVSKLQEYDRLSFKTVFGSGIPDYFRPVSEDSALLEALESGEVDE